MSVTYHDKFQVVDNWMMLLSSEEEVLQFEKELRKYFHSVSDQITLFECEINKNLLLRDTSTQKEMKIAQQKSFVVQFWHQQKKMDFTRYCS